MTQNETTIYAEMAARRNAGPSCVAVLSEPSRRDSGRNEQTVLSVMGSVQHRLEPAETIREGNCQGIPWVAISQWRIKRSIWIPGGWNGNKIPCIIRLRLADRQKGVGYVGDRKGAGG